MDKMERVKYGQLYWLLKFSVCQESPILHLFSLIIIIMSCLCLWTPGLQRSQAWRIRQDKADVLASSPGWLTPSFPLGGNPACFGHLTPSWRATGVARQEQLGSGIWPSVHSPLPLSSHIPHPDQALHSVRNFPQVIHHQILGADLSNCVVGNDLENPLSP